MLGPCNVHCLNRRLYRVQYLPSIRSRPYTERITTKQAVAAAPAAPAAAGTLPKAAAPSRVLFVGGLPAKVDAKVLEQQLEALCIAASCKPTRVQVMTFESEKQRSRFAFGWLHKGFALVAFQDESSVEAAAAAIRAHGPNWGATATMGPAKQLPAGWPAQLTYSASELEVLQQQQAALEVRRAHNRRQRRRQSQRLVDSVDQLLSGLQEPFGAAAQQLYQPLLATQACQHLTTAAAAAASSSAAAAAAAAGAGAGAGAAAVSSSSSTLPASLQGGLRWPVLLQLLLQQQQHMLSIGPIQLTAAASVADVEAQLLLDWSQVPRVLDPAFGGRLADADVVRAGRGRMNLRALRKRVQVESFALLLWQITQHTAAGEAAEPSTPASQNSSSSSSSRSAAPKIATVNTASSSVCGPSPRDGAAAAGAPLHVVEFGCGSGNLILPLAHLFPDFAFTAVDMKASAVQLLQERVQEAGLNNVTAQLGRIEDYAGPADVVLALHACGSATDWALLQAATRRAAFIVSPCCIGKINRHSSSQDDGSSPVSSNGDGVADSMQQQKQETQQQQQQPGSGRFPGANKGLQYPRSQQLLQQMGHLTLQVQQHVQQSAVHGSEPLLNPLQEAVLTHGAEPMAQGAGFKLFSILAATADYSHQDHHSHPELAGLAKTNVELDRGVCMRELGYDVALVRLLQPELTAKSDVLVGLHPQDASSQFCWKQRV